MSWSTVAAQVDRLMLAFNTQLSIWHSFVELRRICGFRGQRFWQPSLYYISQVQGWCRLCTTLSDWSAARLVGLMLEKLNLYGFTVRLPDQSLIWALNCVFLPLTDCQTKHSDRQLAVNAACFSSVVKERMDRHQTGKHVIGAQICCHVPDSTPVDLKRFGTRLLACFRSGVLQGCLQSRCSRLVFQTNWQTGWMGFSSIRQTMSELDIHYLCGSLHCICLLQLKSLTDRNRGRQAYIPYCHTCNESKHLSNLIVLELVL